MQSRYGSMGSLRILDKITHGNYGWQQCVALAAHFVTNDEFRHLCGLVLFTRHLK